jgi:nucleoside 2-deoxyribosyltransferase
LKIYIAAKYDRRLDPRIKDLRAELEAQGHEITAKWLDNAEESKGLREAAMMDVEDVDRADALIFVGEPRGSLNRGGGRWFEFGLAYGLRKRCYAVLPEALDPDDPRRDESVFAHLPRVLRFDSFRALIDYLGSTNSAILEAGNVD